MPSTGGIVWLRNLHMLVEDAVRHHITLGDQVRQGLVSNDMHGTYDLMQVD